MEPISTTLFSLYRGTPFHRDWIVACLEASWAMLLGEKIAHVCRPAALQRHELLVEVLDAAWMPVLASMNEELLTRIRPAAGNEVQSISFKLKPAP